jgi:hypothetical protein
MTVTVKHPFVSAVIDSADTSLVRPSNWNADHTIIGLGTAAEKDVGVANGVASLDSGGKVPVTELPAAVLGALSYQGTWNASTNTPTLASGVGTKGHYYVVSVAGSTNLDGITDWKIGDWAVYNGTAWQKVDNTESVVSVNGQTGVVVLTTTNVAEGTNEYFTTARARTSVSAGTGITYDSGTGVITNSSPSLGGDVVGPTSATDNAIARFDTTTGKLLQNSVVTVSDTGATAGITTLAAVTSVTTPIVQASNSGGLALKNSAGTTQISMGAGGGDNLSINVATNINGANAQIDISPTGTGHVHIKPSGTGGVEIAPTSAGTMNNMVIGGTTPLAASVTDLSVTGTTSFDGSQGTSGQVLTSAGTGATPTWTTPTTGTVTAVTGTAPVVSSGGTTPAISMAAATSSVNGYLTSTDWNTFNSKTSNTGTVTSVAASVPSFLSVSGSPITTSGTLAISYSGTALPVANGGTGLTSVTSTQIPYGNGTGALSTSANLTFDGTNLTVGNGYNLNKNVGFEAGIASTSDATFNSGSYVTFNVENYQRGTSFSTTNYYFTAPVTGYYIFTVGLYFTNSAGATGGMQAGFVKNGSFISSSGGDAQGLISCTPNSLGGTIQLATSMVISLAVGDTVGVQSRSASIRVYRGHCYFSGALLG